MRLSSRVLCLLQLRMLLLALLLLLLLLQMFDGDCLAVSAMASSLCDAAVACYVD